MYNADVTAVIESEGLSNFCELLLQDADELTTILNEITSKVNELKDYLTSDALVNINSEYDEIKKYYNIIKQNIVSYTEDFIDVKNIIEEGMKVVSVKFENEKEEFLKQSREVK